MSKAAGPIIQYAAAASLIAGGIAFQQPGLIAAGVALGLGATAQLLAPKAQLPIGGGDAAQGQTVQQAAAPWRHVYGKAVVGGTVQYFALHRRQRSNAPDWDLLSLVILLASHECDGLEGVYIGDDWVPLAPNTGGGEEWYPETDLIPPEGSKYRPTGLAPLISVHFHAGADGEAGDAWFEDKSGGKWTAASHRGDGLCWVRATLRFRREVFKQGGLPRLAFVLRGAKLYDLRSGTTYWSANPALAIAHYLHSQLGYSAPYDALDQDAWIAAANVCDELVYDGYGHDISRYTVAGSITSEQSREEVITRLARAMGGVVFESAAGWTMHAGAASVLATDAPLTPQDFVGSYELTPNRSSADLFNALTLRFLDAGNRHAEMSTPSLAKPAWLTADGGDVLRHDDQLDLVDRQDQAQRIGWIEAKRNRLQGILKVRLTYAAALLRQPWEVVPVTIPELGWDAEPMQVAEWGDQGIGGVQVTLVAYADSVYDDESFIVPPASEIPTSLTAADDYVTLVGDASTTLDLTANDVTSGGTLSIASLDSNPELTITLQSDNRHVYIARSGSFVGTTTFNYRVSDGALEDVATVHVTIEDDSAPSWGAIDDSATCPVNGEVLIDVLRNDLPSGGVTLLSITQPSHGTTTVVGGKVKYSPNTDYEGADTFTYIMKRNSDAAEDIGSVGVTVSDRVVTWPSGVGNHADIVAGTESWLGRQCTALAGWTDYTNDVLTWDDLRGGPDGDYEIGYRNGTGGKNKTWRPIFDTNGAYNFWENIDAHDDGSVLHHVWCVPLLPKGSGISNSGNGNSGIWARLKTGGDLNATWKSVWKGFGRRLVITLDYYGASYSKVVLDIGWEMTGRSFPWCAGSDHGSFVDAWREMHDALREGLRTEDAAAETAVKLMFRVAGAKAFGASIDTIYPGDDYVDVGGISLHENSDEFDWSTDAGWAAELAGDSDTHGIQEVIDFYSARGKMTGFTEWNIQLLPQTFSWGTLPAAKDPPKSCERVFGLFRDNAAHIHHETYLNNGVNRIMTLSSATASKYKTLWTT